MSGLVLGVDPGITGGYAVLGPDGVIADEFPVVRYRKLAFIDGNRWTRDLFAHGVAGCTAYVESVHAMPRQGVSGVFSFGVAYGSILSALRVAGCRIELVQPEVWKRAHGLVKASKDEKIAVTKARSLACARELFPQVRLSRAGDHGLAEALLIAAYGAELQRRAKVA